MFRVAGRERSISVKVAVEIYCTFVGRGKERGLKSHRIHEGIHKKGLGAWCANKPVMYLSLHNDVRSRREARHWHGDGSGGLRAFWVWKIFSLKSQWQRGNAHYRTSILPCNLTTSLTRDSSLTTCRGTLTQPCTTDRTSCSSPREVGKKILHEHLFAVSTNIPLTFSYHRPCFLAVVHTYSVCEIVQ